MLLATSIGVISRMQSMQSFKWTLWKFWAQKVHWVRTEILALQVQTATYEFCDQTDNLTSPLQMGIIIYTHGVFMWIQRSIPESTDK